MIDKKEILIPLKEHCVYFSDKGTIICSQEYTSPSIKNRGGLKAKTLFHMIILPGQTNLKARTLICRPTLSIFRTMFQKK